ncbi:MAG TPA: polysaccharide biosynthesis C-terminal domain-containing protein, partial [Chitinophagaceae bacterium]|nr:polysaccharide biosynthesis C-terminal domain-containing protein [Chitinophagaceae bacterium]
FSLIWLNFEHAVDTLGLDPIYREGKWVVFLLGLKNIVDMGTGVNAQIIGTSTAWRVDFITGMILLALLIPLNIFLVSTIGIIGAAVSSLGAYIVYNTLRIIFLKRKYNLQPFTRQTLWVLLHAAACFLLVYYSLQNWEGWSGLFIRSAVYVLLFAGTAVLLRLSPDIQPVLQTLRKRLRLGK